MNFKNIEKIEYFKNINLKIINCQEMHNGFYYVKNITFEFDIDDGYCVFTDKQIKSTIVTQLSIPRNKIIIKEIENHINFYINNFIESIKLNIEQELVDEAFNQ